MDGKLHRNPHSAQGAAGPPPHFGGRALAHTRLTAVFTRRLIEKIYFSDKKYCYVEE